MTEVEARWTNEDRRRRLARRHGLLAASNPSGPSPSSAEITDSLIGLHSSDPVTVYLSIAARSRKASVAGIQAELAGLVRHHAMRRTLWVFNREAATMAHAACTRKIAGAERRKLIKALATSSLDDAPADPEQWIENASQAVFEALADGPLTTRALGEGLPQYRLMLQMAGGKAYAATQSALNRVVLQMGFDGVITRGPAAGDGWINSQYQWRLADGIDDRTIEDSQAQQWLARRWLHTFGPGQESDLQWWTGWTLTATRRALADIDAVAVALEDGSGGPDEVGWILADDVEPDSRQEDWTAVLPGLDPTVMGWKHRNWYLNPDHVATLFDRNGNGGPTLWVNGRAVGGWVQRADGSLSYRLLESIGRVQRESLEQQLDRMAAFIEDTRFKVRFPAPLQKELYAE